MLGWIGFLSILSGLFIIQSFRKISGRNDIQSLEIESAGLGQKKARLVAIVSGGLVAFNY
jgi:hypothetical protein